MAINRSQFPELMGYDEGGDVTNIFDYQPPKLDPNVMDFANFDLSPLAVTPQETQGGDVTREDFLVGGGGPTQADIQAYKDLLKTTLKMDKDKSSQRGDFYDLASTVGRTMLAADPTAGAFRSLGLGLAQYNEDEKARREKLRELDRQVALKAFELAKQDEDAALKYLQEYDLAVAKEQGALTYHRVTDASLTLGVGDQSHTYQQGEIAPLTRQERAAHRFKVGPEITGGTKTFKTTQRGQLVNYMKKVDAEQMIEGLGLPRENPNFNRVVESITAKSPDQVGQPVVTGGAFAELSPFTQGDKVINIMLSPSENAEKPLFNKYAETRLSEIAKNQTVVQDLETSTIPRLDMALNQLLANPNLKTGPTTEFFLGVRKLLAENLGASEDEIEKLNSLDSLASISYALAPKMRPKGSGSTSDMEFKAYQKAILSLSNLTDANYINLYAFRKMIINSNALLAKETDLLTEGKMANTEQVNNELKKIDTGIFAKIPPEITAESLKTPEGKSAANEYLNGLPDGAVIDNSQGIFPGPTFLIKRPGSLIVNPDEGF